MAERPEDFNLPTSVITRIVKDALPEGVNVSKEAKSALSKAASVFVLYATTCANNFTLKDKRKTLSGNDVLAAVQDMEFDMFLEPLQENLNALRTIKAKKSGSSSKNKKMESDRTVDSEDDVQEMEVYKKEEENQNTDEL
ncbi:DNA polymerase epsilon subunit 3-like [Tachypleus tridentatus]|uniref:DNA polymerase epsilon subunit 3-like n=1 Tax=Tachypleus tridentatus TaxID=6853 RepID=UPI003FD2C5E8